MRDNQIFYQIIQSNVHEQILSRSVDLLHYMLDNGIIGWKEIDYIWSIVPHSDARGRTTIEKLIGDISKYLSLEFVERIIDRILSVKESEITIEKLNLLKVLKNRELNKEYNMKILAYLWDCITIKSSNIKSSVEEEV